MQIQSKYEKLLSHPKFANCGVKLRSKDESLEIIKEQLEQLKLEGKGQSMLAKIYKSILNRTE